MTDLTIRLYHDDDAALVAGLMNAVEAAGGAGHAFSEDEVRGMMSGYRELAHNTRLVVAAGRSPAGRPLAAAGVVEPPVGGGTRVRTHGGVDPRWRGRGIGRMLLSWQFSRAAEVRAAQAPDVGWTVGAGAGSADESAARLFRRFGLHPVRYFLEMSAPTAGDRQVRPPEGVRIAGFAAGMRAALHAAHMEAFAGHWGFEPRSIEEWAVRTVDLAVFRGDLSRVALDGGQIAAFLLAYDGQGSSLYIGQVGTRPRWRRRGLATALIADSLTAGTAAGKTTAVLGVDAANPTGAVGVYERLGFTAQHSPFALYEKVLAA
jgi:mycothiol synthase